MTKRFYLAIFIICGAILFLLPFRSDEKLHLIFCDVGQGDAILVKYKDLQAVIDGGPSMSGMTECLSQNIPPWDRELELMILTHPDSDHLTGLVDVLERYDVRQIVVNSVAKDSAVFWQFYQKVLAEGAQIYSPQAGDKLKLGPIVFSVFWPEEKLGDSRIWEVTPGVSADFTPGVDILGAATVSKKINETSIVLKLSYGNFDALLTGDIGFDTENQIDFPEVEVIKVPHHGSKFSTSDEFLGESSPELAVISVGKNSFGHPTQEVLDKLKRLGIKTLRTDQERGVEIISDGKKWFVSSP